MDTRELKAQVPEPDQALIVSEIFTRITAGVPIKTIADDLTARKIPAPRSAAKWERSVVRRIALNPPTSAGAATTARCSTRYGRRW